MITRRSIIGLAPSLAGFVLLHRSARAHSLLRSTNVPDLPTEFPRQPSTLVSRIVGLAHRDLEGVKALLQERRSLANAAWDWGFGDWETPLGAAAHTGRTAIAELLLEYGATPTIFSAVCLGQLDLVRAMLEQNPKLRSHLGPHGITLMAHARNGGERAATVLAYLRQFPETDQPVPNLPLPASVRQRLVGRYPFGETPEAYLEIAERGEGITLMRSGSSALNLRYQGELRFFPGGTTDATISFEVDSTSVVMEIRDPAPIARLTRRA